MSIDGCKEAQRRSGWLKPILEEATVQATALRGIMDGTMEAVPVGTLAMVERRLSEVSAKMYDYADEIDALRFTNGDIASLLSDLRSGRLVG